MKKERKERKGFEGGPLEQEKEVKTWPFSMDIRRKRKSKRRTRFVVREKEGVMVLKGRFNVCSLFFRSKKGRESLV